MERIVQQVGSIPAQPKALRVAAYARVSSGKDAMLHSLSAQVSYYSSLIQNHSGWLYCGVYADEALTGTKENRTEFQRLLAECRAGSIDLIITKSISRFARNTVVLLQTVRDLKSLGVDVYFEEQNIHSMSADGELMLTILASYAQEESLSASENQKWRIKKNFEDGKPWSGQVLGYKYVDGVYIVKPEEAEIVRSIFADYLSGMGVEAIMKKLNVEAGPRATDTHGAAPVCGRCWATIPTLAICSSRPHFGRTTSPKRRSPTVVNCRCTMPRTLTRPSSAWRITKRCRRRWLGAPPSTTRPSAAPPSTPSRK